MLDSRWTEVLRITAADFRANWIRSLLSVSGIVIGIASVTAVLVLGGGLQRHILEEYTESGADRFVIYPNYSSKLQVSGRLDEKVRARLAEVPGVLRVLGRLGKEESVRSRYGTATAKLSGFEAPWLEIREIKMEAGRAPDSKQARGRERIVWIGTRLQRSLFGEERAVGEMIWVGGQPLRIAGVFKEIEGAREIGPRSALVPMEALRRLLESTAFNQFELHAAEGHPRMAENIWMALSQGQEPRRALFFLEDGSKKKQQNQKVGSMLTGVGALIAMISLVVGGIGVMNVMLTSVTERTREIGLRRALGARKKDILVQFLIESGVLCATGGVLGFAFGALLAGFLISLLRQFTGADLPYGMRPSFFFVAFCSAAVLGFLFGLYPASKASRLPPSEALRME